jgi:ubiquinone/menaquinone biosynthesis C-methylase UbiE
MSVYDAMAPAFDRRRSLPGGVPEKIRAAVLGACSSNVPRLLDLGAGSGRIGRPFVQAGDDYTAVDLSLGMLREFAQRSPAARLAQADGARLPFADGSFDAALLVQVLSGASGWRHLLADTIRVLRPDGALIVGRVVAPDNGIDAQMKTHLAGILDAIDIHPYRDKPRDDALSWLHRALPSRLVQDAATWVAERTPRAFLERHSGGARFSVLPEAVRQTAMASLAAWASGAFGSLDIAFQEDYRFELMIHRHQ